MLNEDSLIRLNLWEGAKAILGDLYVVNLKENQIFVNTKKLICNLFLDFNGFEIKVTPTEIFIYADQPASIITAIFVLKKQVETNSIRNTKQVLLFKTRFFKKEIGFKNFSNLTEEKNNTEEFGLSEGYLENYMQELVKRGFNSFLIYAGYHPFEYFLDFIGFKQAVPKGSNKIRERNFNYIKRITKIAKKYGIKTFLHHYVSHFPQTLSDHLKLGLSEKQGRLAAFDHPEIEKYNIYIYKRTIETLPELDGFLFNFESIGNAVPFMKKTIFKAIQMTKSKPILFFRLWGVSDLEGMKEILNDYDGPKGLMHKSHETNDVYYYPSCDDRVKIWKKHLPEIEFTFSMGPCHNCATNLTNVIWNDSIYTKTLIKSMIKKGADSVSFQSGKEIIASLITNNQFDSEASIQFSKANYGHLESFCDVIWGKTISENDWIERYADWNQVSVSDARNIKIAIEESSQIILKAKWQFCYGSAQEGFLYPARNSYYQEPFFYQPMSFMNRIGEIPYKIAQTAWLVRRKKIKVLPDDTQLIIDYVNPSVKKKPRFHPKALADLIKRYVSVSNLAIKQYSNSQGNKADKNLIEFITNNIIFGERTWREIYIGIELYSCYFIKTKKEFIKHIQTAIKLLNDTVNKVDLKIADRFNNTTSSGPFTPAEDAIEISRLLKFLEEDFPFIAFRHYIASHVHYNEIRRMSRSYASVREEVITKNRELLIKAKYEAEKSLSYLLDNHTNAIYKENVNIWLKYLDSEITDLIPPAMRCYPAESLGADEGFYAMRHDQNYRWGEKCWEDFLSFFKYQNFFREDKMDCRVTYDKDFLVVSMREHGIIYKEREEIWEKNKGGVNQTGFMQIFLDIGNSGNKINKFTLFFKGEGGRESEFEELPNGYIDGTKGTELFGITAIFAHNDTSWRVDVKIPWLKLGAKPKVGDIWRMNVFSNPAVKRNRRSIWCQGYEMKNDIARLGVIHFSK